MKLKPFRHSKSRANHFTLTWISHGHAAMEFCYFPCRESAETERSATPSWTSDAEGPVRRHKSLRNRSPVSSVCLSVSSSSSLSPRPFRIERAVWNLDEASSFGNPPPWTATLARLDLMASCWPKSSKWISEQSIAPRRYVWRPSAIFAPFSPVAERWLEENGWNEKVENFNDFFWGCTKFARTCRQNVGREIVVKGGGGSRGSPYWF